MGRTRSGPSQGFARATNRSYASRHAISLRPVEQLPTLVEADASDVRRLQRSHSTTEQTYYPAVHDLWTGIVRHLQLQFDVRFGTSEGRVTGTDHPDVAFYDKGD